MLGDAAARGSKFLSVAVTVVPVYWTLIQLATYTTADGKSLTDEAKAILYHPVTILLIAYGTAYASVPDGAAITQSLAVISAVAYYVFVLHPEMGEKYFNTKK